MGLLNVWLRRRAVKRMAHQLVGDLATSYGSSKHYTVPQIEFAYRKIGISEKYIDVAFAEFLDFETYTSFTGKDREVYDLTRAIFRYYIPERLDHPVHPAGVNVYISQMTGL